MIKEMRTYVEDGKSLHAAFTIDKDLNIIPETAEFSGRIGIPTNMGTMPVDFTFPEGYTIDKCFDEYQEIAEKAVEKKIEEVQEQQRIMPASGMPKEDNIIQMP